MALAYKTAATALMAGARSLASRPNSLARNLAPKPIPTSPFSPSAARPITRTASRVVVVMGSVESMMPLHSAIASARLRSNIAVDSNRWSWLSQGSIVVPARNPIVTRFRLVIQRTIN